jgi:hypothetical protein
MCGLSPDSACTVRPAAHAPPERRSSRYLTVSVPSMPAARWPGTEQKNL